MRKRRVSGNGRLFTIFQLVPFLKFSSVLTLPRSKSAVEIKFPKKFWKNSAIECRHKKLFAIFSPNFKAATMAVVSNIISSMTLMFYAYTFNHE